MEMEMLTTLRSWRKSRAHPLSPQGRCREREDLGHMPLLGSVRRVLGVPRLGIGQFKLKEWGEWEHEAYRCWKSQIRNLYLHVALRAAV